ncbi:hypothetical protein E0L10_12365 [Enterococcus durans]|uniref:hypothetical protein n=1 Tax=Enterococcus durans TaxID=53345 RepID=UPI0014322ED1|nr:hypothetical protein [Enterococcus durans]NJE64881.1 hypothetical protein [Enterococcus durans]
MFKNIGNLILEKIDILTSNKGKEFKIIRLIDIENYEKFDLFASDDLEISCGLGEICQVTVQAKKNGFKTGFYVKEIISA